ncbi:hypothetical protein ACXAAV_11970 [Vibrio coralliilyticus]
MTISEVASVAAAIGTIAAMIVSWRGHRYAKKAYLIAEEAHKNQLKHISSYLIDSMKWKSGDVTYVSFAISYTNDATIQNSISSILLKLKFGQMDKKYPTFRASQVDLSPIKSNGYKNLVAPILLNGRETLSGWVTFELPKSLDGSVVIEKYTLEAQTVSGQIVETSSNLVNYVIEKTN